MEVDSLRQMLYGLEKGDSVKVLNENSPVKGAQEIDNAFVIEDAEGNKTVVLMYESKNRKEGF